MTMSKIAKEIVTALLGPGSRKMAKNKKDNH